MAIGYKDFTPKERERIWKSLLKPVLEDASDEDKAILEEALSKLSEYTLNGREIRNAIRLAMFLALDDLSTDGKVQLKHIKQAMGEVKEFRQFFEDAKKNHTNKNRVWVPFASSQDEFS
ncbi:hypothetical protein EV356DRAFT_528144 [Viridothelium virens]|uniref:AAA+ ATPase lid domain-containing protein n=1 Tax=Viridothelium virens TaxID=1048519 RepID=A0A6A6HPR9_VIRVR|nr:hypothetical protein EV356DRAFT_528144 [Viridothelium virens]